MCVILVCPESSARPSREVLEACHQANPHGAGLAWRERKRVRWMKNLDVDDTEALLAELPGEVVIHFRWASVGGIDADLCHPFPVTATAKTDLFGEADSVLFHNGTWSAYEEALRLLRKERGKRIPRGPMSDTRAAAICLHAIGPRLLPKLPGRWVWMSATRTRLYGSWCDFEGMKVSNLWFLPRPERAEPAWWADACFRQLDLWKWPEEGDENGEANGATTRGTATSPLEL